jgi:Prokaryotic N-terminal methylation motif
MRSNSRRRQAAQSLVEVVVASAILGITVVVALETIDASIRGGQQVVSEAWAQCMVRETAGAIQQASWATQYPSPDPALKIQVAGPPSQPEPEDLQTITIKALDPRSGSTLYSVSFLKSAALQGKDPVDAALPHLASACPKP